LSFRAERACARARAPHLVVQLRHDAVEAARDLDRRLVALHLEDLVELRDAVADLYKPAQDLDLLSRGAGGGKRSA